MPVCLTLPALLKYFLSPRERPRVYYGFKRTSVRTLSLPRPEVRSAADYAVTHSDPQMRLGMVRCATGGERRVGKSVGLYCTWLHAPLVLESLLCQMFIYCFFSIRLRAVIEEKQFPPSKSPPCNLGMILGFPEQTNTIQTRVWSKQFFSIWGTVRAQGVFCCSCLGGRGYKNG